MEVGHDSSYTYPSSTAIVHRHPNQHTCIRTFKDVEVGGYARLAELAVHARGVAEEEVARAGEQQRGREAGEVPVH